MPTDAIRVRINGKETDVPQRTTVAAAILRSGTAALRRSVSGEARGPLCAMGICFECRVTVNRVPHVRSCQVLCEPDMEIVCDE